MKRIILFIGIFILTVNLIGQTGTGWAQQRAKMNFKDSTNFVKAATFENTIIMNGSAAGSTTLRPFTTASGTLVYPTSAGTDTIATRAYARSVTSAIQTQIDGKITKGIIDSVNSIGTDAQFFSTAGDTLLPYIPYEDRITSNPYFKGQTNTDSLLIHGAYAERTTVNKLKIGGNNSPGTSATPAGDVAILLDSYMSTDTTMSVNHIARIRSQNMMSSHHGSNLIFDTHTSLQDTYGVSTYLLPAMILDYNGSVITPFRNTGTVSNSGGITHAQLARLMYYDEAAATDIMKDPQIVCNEAYARDGTIITIMGSSDTYWLKLDDGAGLQLAGGNSFTIGLGDTITLVFNSTLNLWVELSRSDN